MGPKSKFFLLLGSGIAFIVGVFVFMAPSSEPLPGSLIGPPSLSPDGRLIAFTYGKTVGDNSLLLYDIESEQLRLIDKPSHLFVRRPSFSPDGQHLAVGTYCNEGCDHEEKYYQIATIDLDDSELTFVTSGRAYVRNGPIFSADGGAIFFTAHEIFWRDEWIALNRRWPNDWDESHPATSSGLSKVSLETKEETRLFPNSEHSVRFLGCTVGSATDQGDVYFSAVHPMGGVPEPEVAEIGRKTDTLGYVFRHTGELELQAQNTDWPMSSISSSADGKTQIFVSSPAADRYKYDLFRLVDGNVSQISFLGTHMSYAKISANGQKVVFLADAERRRNWSIWTHNVDTGQTQLTLEYEKIRMFLGLSEEHD